MTVEQYVNFVLPVGAFLIGCCVGSFLNVVIYRLPLGMRVDQPKRSFCPSCKYQIPSWLNLPVLSWILLRGKCANCGSRISIRYPVIEFMTGCAFLALWLAFPPAQAIAYWVLISLMIGATFIDFEHFIIPDSITKGGAVAGVLACVAVPTLMETSSRLKALGYSALGAAVGFALLWLVVRLGKLAFGKIVQEFEKPAGWDISQPKEDENPQITIAGEKNDWCDVFFRPSDRLIMECTELVVNGEPKSAQTVTVFHDRFMIDGERVALEDVKSVSGKATKFTIPREAMGFGDVKYIAMIGAFLGWKAVLFTVFAAAIVGAVVGILQKIIAREEWARPIPFGPYLTLGAVGWMVAGKDILHWYLRAMGLDGLV